MKVVFETALGSYQVQRLPLRTKQPLQAWDAADELLLNTLAQQYPEKLTDLTDKTDKQTSALLLINDQFGALATALYQHTPDCWSDSFISHQASEFNIQDNFAEKQNGEDGDTIQRTVNDTLNYPLNSSRNYRPIKSTEALQGNYSVVLIKIPKTLALLEQQLSTLSQHISADTLIIAAGMTKHIHNSTLALFEKYIGTTKTSRATKKARLIFSQCDKSQNDPDQQSALIESRYFCEQLNAELISYANGFSRERLDIGARAMLQALEKNDVPNAHNIADLCAGNGVLGLYAVKKLIAQKAFAGDTEGNQPKDDKLTISFIDESYMAIAAAQSNFDLLTQSEIDSNIQGHFIAQDGIRAKKQNRYDWIICNPPFHIGTSTDTSVAKRMLQQSYQALQVNGQLWVVANRHLDYADTIQDLFKNHQIILSNSKFIVISAVKNRA